MGNHVNKKERKKRTFAILYICQTSTTNHQIIPGSLKAPQVKQELFTLSTKPEFTVHKIYQKIIVWFGFLFFYYLQKTMAAVEEGKTINKRRTDVLPQGTKASE